MLRAYARTGADPVFAEDDAAVQRADADAQLRSSRGARGAAPDERETSCSMPGPS